MAAGAATSDCMITPQVSLLHHVLQQSLGYDGQLLAALPAAWQHYCRTSRHVCRRCCRTAQHRGCSYTCAWACACARVGIVCWQDMQCLQGCCELRGAHRLTEAEVCTTVQRMLLY